MPYPLPKPFLKKHNWQLNMINVNIEFQSIFYHAIPFLAVEVVPRRLIESCLPMAIPRRHHNFIFHNFIRFDI